MDRAVYAAAVALLNSGRPFDGGLFRSVRDSRLLVSLARNGTSAALTAFLPSLTGRVFIGGSLAMLSVACVSALVVAALACCTFVCAWRTVRRERSRRDSYLAETRRRRQELRQRLRSGRSVSCWLAAACFLMLALTLIPLILASASNFRLHQSLSQDSQDPRDGGAEDKVLNRFFRLLDRADAFLAGLVGQIRAEAAPVMLDAERLTDGLKTRAQAGYEDAFKRITGAAQMLEAGDELLSRMSDFYYSGRSLSLAMEQLQAALSDLGNAQFFAYEDVCRKYHSDTDRLCANHTRAAALLLQTVHDVRNDWTLVNATSDREQQPNSLEAHAKDITRLVYQFVGALDGSGNTPEHQQQIRSQKMSIGDEINRNISRVFDRELNSTEFLIKSVDSELQLLKDQVRYARSALASFRRKISGVYANSVTGPEGARFGLTLGLQILFFCCIVALAAGVAPVVLRSLRSNSRLRYFIGALYLITFLIVAAAILLNTAMYTATAVLQAEVCRYLWDVKSPVSRAKADEFLVPEVNDILEEMRNQTAGDPSAPQIPFTAVGSILSALQHTCAQNLPALVALGADKFIDKSTLDKTAETVAFQVKGLGILQREMRNLNLEQLRDEKLPENLQNLKPFFRSYTSTDFARLSQRLAPRAVTAAALATDLAAFQRINDQVERLFPDSERSVRQLSAMNTKNAVRNLRAANVLKKYVADFEPCLNRLNARKDVNSVVDQVIARHYVLDSYLTNRTLWVETASRSYREHILVGTLNESLWIAQTVGTKFLTSIVRCRDLHEIYHSAVALPCAVLLQPLAVQCFCIGWLLCCSFVLILFTMLGFCRSRVWLTGISAFRPVESALMQVAEVQEMVVNADKSSSSSGEELSSQGSNSESPVELNHLTVPEIRITSTS